MSINSSSRVIRERGWEAFLRLLPAEEKNEALIKANLKIQELFNDLVRLYNFRRRFDF